MTIPRYSDPIPSLTTDQMIEVDRAMVEDFHIDLLQMMENAGRNLASLARERFLDNHPEGKHIAVLAGTGGNGGGALVGRRDAYTTGEHMYGFFLHGQTRISLLCPRINLILYAGCMCRSFRPGRCRIVSTPT